MAYPERRAYRDEPVAYDHPAVVERGNGLTGYAVAKYAFMLAITLAILAFLAWYIIPLVRR